MQTSFCRLRNCINISAGVSTKLIWIYLTDTAACKCITLHVYVTKTASLQFNKINLKDANDTKTCKNGPVANPLINNLQQCQCVLFQSYDLHFRHTIRINIIVTFARRAIISNKRCHIGMNLETSEEGKIIVNLPWCPTVR